MHLLCSRKFLISIVERGLPSADGAKRTHPIAKEKLIAQKPNEHSFASMKWKVLDRFPAKILNAYKLTLCMDRISTSHRLNFDYRVRSMSGHHKWLDGMVNNVSYQIVENFMYPGQTRWLGKVGWQMWSKATSSKWNMPKYDFIYPLLSMWRTSCLGNFQCQASF